jgi:hypothetical protein
MLSAVGIHVVYGVEDVNIFIVTHLDIRHQLLLMPAIQI